MLPAACNAPDTDQFAQVRPGMTQAEVEQVLGRPSSHTQVPADRQDLVGYHERWQYGDSLSSLVSGAVFTEAADDRVFVVYFDDEGRVVRTRAPLSGPQQMTAPR